MAMLLSDPFDALFNFQQALDAFRTSGWLGAGPSGGGAYPPLNVFRKGDDIVIITEVPGVRKEDLQVQVKGNTIRIAGRKSVQYGEQASVHRRERMAGSFDRAVSVPVEIDGDKVRAECRDGILALYLSRAERDKPKSIAIS
ncbi:MAG TPA: Hsp20/alpha crystallin family protein [Stellaceae bacterium]|nr:Hsp20/alpha crystallin family protein [Stellaceae bacterium]